MGPKGFVRMLCADLSDIIDKKKPVGLEKNLHHVETLDRLRTVNGEEHESEHGLKITMNDGSMFVMAIRKIN